MSVSSPARLAASIALTVAALSLSACAGAAGPMPSAGPDGSPAPFRLEVGQCIAAESGTPQSEETVDSLPVVPCEQAHVHEVFAGFELAPGGYPGQERIVEQANDGCLQRFEAFVGVPPSRSELKTSSLYPTEHSWSAGDREVLCLVRAPEGETTGSLAGAQR